MRVCFCHPHLLINMFGVGVCACALAARTSSKRCLGLGFVRVLSQPAPRHKYVLGWGLCVGSRSPHLLISSGSSPSPHPCPCGHTIRSLSISAPGGWGGLGCCHGGSRGTRIQTDWLIARAWTSGGGRGLTEAASRTARSWGIWATINPIWGTRAHLVGPHRSACGQADWGCLERR